VLFYVDRVSALSLASIWSLRRRSECPGCLRKGESVQGGNAADKSPRVEP